MKKYKGIFFDWDGTAVISRKAPAEEAAAAMKGLLEKGVKLVIVSGTTYEKIAGGKLEEYFTEAELEHLYLGLGRGAYNYRFEKGKPVVFADRIPDREGILRIHDTAYGIHRELFASYGLETDVVFCRPNYCKIDLMAGSDRGGHLFMQESEIESLKAILNAHGIKGGLGELLEIAGNVGQRHGVEIKATCDAKYLEAGISDKSDNTDVIFGELEKRFQIKGEECCFWGDEFVGLEEGIYGSDSFMITEKTKNGDFYDVSSVNGKRPENVRQIGGGVERFLHFLKEQEGGF